MLEKKYFCLRKREGKQNPLERRSFVAVVWRPPGTGGATYSTSDVPLWADFNREGQTTQWVSTLPLVSYRPSDSPNAPFYFFAGSSSSIILTAAAAVQEAEIMVGDKRPYRSFHGSLIRLQSHNEPQWEKKQIVEKRRVKRKSFQG